MVNRTEAKRNRAHSDAQRELLRSWAIPAARIGAAWVTCPPARRGRYQTALGKAFRKMLAAGVRVPSEAQVERDITAAWRR